MGSRKEEEKNERIIRGLMKLPPNRRCINCNSLGPQFICTNFWTFICLTCSGIHREFTHRVKSVSMSRFTSQEVKALEKGGNQRAREIYLKDWDHQRQRLPDNSNVDKVREFIKNTYVDKRYAGGRTLDKPPRDMQGLRSHEDETRRASSYHSYSQSPPYDFQYEDRRYGKHGAILTRKPGSDQGLYLGKMSSFVCSPTHLSERSLEDRFANEGSISRVSDYSVSSGGDQTRSGMVSPNFQKDIGFSSPPNQHSSDILGDHTQHQTTNLLNEKNFRRDAVRILQPQRTSSYESTHAFDSNATCLKPFNSGNSVEVALEPEKAAGMPRNKLPGCPPSFSPTSHGCLDLFNPPVVPESESPVASAIDLFQKRAESPAKMVDLFEELPSNPAPSMNAPQLSFAPTIHGCLDLFNPPVVTESQSPAASSAIDLFQKQTESPPNMVDLFEESPANLAPSMNAPQPSLSPALDLFSGHPVTISNEKTPEQLFPKNEGWATFDSPQPVTSTSGKGNLMPSGIPSNVGSSAEIAHVSSLTTNLQWPTFPNYSIQSPSPVSDPWHDNLLSIQACGGTAGAQTWNALDNSVTHLPMESINQNCELQDFAKDKIQKPASYRGVLGSSGPLDIATGPSHAPPVYPLMEEITSHTTDRRSTNPFDFPYDSESEPGNVFLDMSSLQTALPDTHLPSTLLGNVTQPWFPQEPIASYIPGGLAYMAGQAPSPQLANLQAQEPVMPIRGNPFA